jgi:hypothetical protein
MMLVSQLSISGIIYQFVLHIQELNRNLRVDEKYMDGGLYVHLLSILRSTSLVTVVFYFLCLYTDISKTASLGFSRYVQLILQLPWTHSRFIR